MIRFAILLVALIPPVSQAIEEPGHEVVRQIGEQIEVRRYAPYVVAEVVLETTAANAGNQAFPILAGYIFGKNKGQRKLEMTAPVTQSAEPVKLAMTAPVTQDAVPGGMRVQFVLPKDVTLATAPEPLDPRVRLREESPALRAVIRYSGTWSQANYDEHLGKLKAALAAAGIATEGEPVLARYNGPMTPWFMRRNEIWLALP
jgi:SOUL heme-binding protein